MLIFNDFTPLSRAFYGRAAELVAPDLLGKIIVRKIGDQILAGKIVEVEAYLGASDPASHAYKGKTKRNASVFKDAGHLYVHQIHRHSCVDIVTNTFEVAGSVLLRALEPLMGIEQMMSNRQIDNRIQIANGPGKLCQALVINKALDGVDITQANSPVFLINSPEPTTEKIAISVRIGINKGQEMPLRYYLAGNPFLSR
jgi:DNA-3-methyladenine glycosylase